MVLTLTVPLLASAGFLLATSASASSPSQLNLLPLPAQHTTGNTVVCLDPAFSVEISGPGQVPDDLSKAAERLIENLQKNSHHFLSPTHGHEFFKEKGCERHISKLVLHVASSESIMDGITEPVDGRADREAYKLSVPKEGDAKASADTALGGFRALTSFENLFFTLDAERTGRTSEQVPLRAGNSRVTYAPFAPYEINDKPAFPWRALHLDTSRQFFSVETILRQIDAMSTVKLNVFHWHVTDSNSWPLELKSLPELAAKGAYSGGRTYSEKQVREIVTYAGERGIDVVMEIDTPGHTAIIAESYPQYIACEDHRPWTGWAHQPPAGQLRFADPEVVVFTSKIFEDAAALTKSRYFGTGGDELNLRCMEADKPTTAKLSERGLSLQEALKDFTVKTHKTLTDAGRTPMVWQEMVLDHGDLGLTKDTIVDIWVNSKDARAVLDQGFRIVHAAGDYFYLDCGQGGWITENQGSNSWCDPFKAWTRMYTFDPFANVTESQRELVLGGQASMWAEQTDESNLEPTVWPRAAAVAELFWTGADKGSYPRNAIDALPRMHDTRFRLVDRGIRAVPLQPEWCALRPGVCVLNG